MRPSAIECGGPERAQDEAPQVAPHRERTILGIQAAIDVAVALEQTRTEAEQHDLLGVILARDHGLEIDLHTRLG